MNGTILPAKAFDQSFLIDKDSDKQNQVGLKIREIRHPYIVININLEIKSESSLWIDLDSFQLAPVLSSMRFGAIAP